MLTAERTLGDFGMTITDSTNNSMQIDIPVDQGGNGKGMRPMQTILAALCGCSAVDVVSILKKQKQELTGFKILVDGEREHGKEPSVWEKVDLVFELTGNIEPNKGFRAVKLSVDKYCSVAETIRRAGASINYKVLVNGEEVSGE
ncbi:MAG: OsmC family protein [Chitinophagaceae bacterium]|nr:OsmC family protein [Chitinophagaceae bacterium]